jgi:predicted nucleic acid-binding protein
MKTYASLKINKYKLFLSPLTIDELWCAVFNEMKDQGQVTSYTNSFPFIKKSWDSIKKSKIKLIQIKRPIDDGVENAISYINQFNLHPRDSFHLACALSQNITEIVTKDSDISNTDLGSIGMQAITF